MWFRWHVAACRCIFFHSEGLCLYSGMQDSLKVFGWEPARSYDTVAMGWGKVADISIAQNQLVRHTVKQSCSFTDIKKLFCYVYTYPYSNMYMHQHAYMRTHTCKLNSLNQWFTSSVLDMEFCIFKIHFQESFRSSFFYGWMCGHFSGWVSVIGMNLKPLDFENSRVHCVFSGFQCSHQHEFGKL